MAPLQRWDTDAVYAPDAGADSVYSRHGSFLAGVEDFDGGLFKLSRAEAVPMDPHARLLLETAQVGRSWSHWPACACGRSCRVWSACAVSDGCSGATWSKWPGHLLVLRLA